MVKSEKRMQDMLNQHHKNMQAFINEQFYAYDKVFSRGMSASALEIIRTENINDEEGACERSFATKFTLPLDSTEELVMWNAELKNELYSKFMVSFHVFTVILLWCIRRVCLQFLRFDFRLIDLFLFFN